MIESEDQSEIIAFLGDPNTHGVDKVERIETHSAIIFLVGNSALKLKRAVKFPFLDFSTVERRGDCCKREVDLNRRTAPTLYRDAVPITRGGNGDLSLGGSGEPIDWVVSMNRFEQSSLFDRMALDDALTPEMMIALADAIAAFHCDAEPMPAKGGAQAMRWVMEDNIEEMRTFPEIFESAAVTALAENSGPTFDRIADLLDRRRDDGFVRHCHGDLHLQNICLLEDRPTLFDCIEFNDDIACVDTLYDLAFLLMDLDHRDRHDDANLVLNRYLARTGDMRALPALRFFLSCRAAVKAKVTAIAAKGNVGRIRDAQSFLQLALDYLVPTSPRLIAIGGTPGTGKSTLAQGLAPEIGAGCGAILMRTDVLRKHMLGVDILERLPESAYDRETTQRTYDRVVKETEAALDAGLSVIADATFTNAQFRKRIEAIAHARDLPFTGIWLDADFELRERRIAARTNDPSDATVDLIRRFRDEPDIPEAWHHLDAGQSLDRLIITAHEKF
jgi:uncharacterized protein